MSANPADVMPFSRLLGVEVTRVEAGLVEGALTVREDLCTAGGMMHGGAIMALADTLGAIAGFNALPDGAQGTTTIESKTNFLGAAPVGERVTARTMALSTGRRLSVWQTEILRSDGKRVAVVTQTQLVL